MFLGCPNAENRKKHLKTYQWFHGQLTVSKHSTCGQPYEFALCALPFELTENSRKLHQQNIPEHKYWHYNYIVNQLTKREHEVIREIAQGHTDKAIGRLLNISKYTVQTHRRNLLRKTNCRNTARLIVFAVECGLHV